MAPTLPLAAVAERCPISAELCTEQAAVSTSSPSLCLVPGSPGLCGQSLGPGGWEHRQASLAGRWMAAPLQFCIPFLPDKPRRIFINQSATLFNKNLLTYK